MSLNGRMAKLEEAHSAQRQALQQTVYRQFMDWLKDNMTPAEAGAFDRSIFAIAEPPTDEMLSSMNITRARCDEVRAEIGPPRDGDEILLKAVVARFPVDLEARCLAAGVFLTPLIRE